MVTDLPPLHAMLPPKVPSVCLQNALFHTELLRIKEADFVGKEVWQWARAIEITGVSVFPTIVKQPA